MNYQLKLTGKEFTIYSFLRKHQNWHTNVSIAHYCGTMMHNYCAKILARLINYGLVQSRYCVKGGEQKKYKEYKAI